MLDDEYLLENENHIHCIDQSQTKCYLTKEEHDHAKENQEVDSLNPQLDDYQRGYQMVVFELQRQYNLRNRDVNVNKEKVEAENPSTSQPKRILQKKPLQEKVNDKKQGEVKDSQENRKEIITKDTDKTQSAFSLENELSKIKIPIPFGELLKNSQYKGQIAKMFRA